MGIELAIEFIEYLHFMTTSIVGAQVCSGDPVTVRPLCSQDGCQCSNPVPEMWCLL
jgi:hypothetical protein